MAGPDPPGDPGAPWGPPERTVPGAATMVHGRGRGPTGTPVSARRLKALPPGASRFSIRAHRGCLGNPKPSPEAALAERFVVLDRPSTSALPFPREGATHLLILCKRVVCQGASRFFEAVRPTPRSFLFPLREGASRFSPARPEEGTRRATTRSSLLRNPPGRPGGNGSGARISGRRSRSLGISRTPFTASSCKVSPRRHPMGKRLVPGLACGWRRWRKASGYNRRGLHGAGPAPRRDRVLRDPRKGWGRKVTGRITGHLPGGDRNRGRTPP